MAEQIEPSPLRQAFAVCVFLVVSTASAIATELILAAATRRWLLPAWTGPGSPQSPILVDVDADPGGQLVEQLGEQLAAEQLADQLDDQTAGVVVDLQEASAE